MLTTTVAPPRGWSRGTLIYRYRSSARAYFLPALGKISSAGLRSPRAFQTESGRVAPERSHNLCASFYGLRSASNRVTPRVPISSCLSSSQRGSYSRASTHKDASLLRPLGISQVRYQAKRKLLTKLNPVDLPCSNHRRYTAENEPTITAVARFRAYTITRIQISPVPTFTESRLGPSQHSTVIFKFRFSK